MKDESGIVGVMKAALESCQDESVKKKMNIVKNAFLTGRQAESNIGVIFLETGLKKNRSKFLKQIHEEQINQSNQDKVIEVGGSME